MILYTYKCTGCENIRDSMVSVNDRDKDIWCPWCNNVMVRQFAAPGIVIK